MPRSASSPFNYSVPSGTAAVSGQVISSVAYNSFLSDLTNNALNAAWPVAYGGTGTTDGSALVPDGSAATPAVRFQNETNTGAYRSGAGEYDISILGTKRLALTASGLNIVGTISSNGSPIGTALSNDPFYNLSLSVSVAANALTIALKGADGNDPSATNPVIVNFRSATATSGLSAQLSVTAATSLVVSSGSTLGTTNGVAATLAVVAFNDGGTFRLGIINPTTNLSASSGIASSTAEGGAGAADSAGVFYTGTAVTSKAYTVLSYIVISEATAGTWASAPTSVQLMPYIPNYQEGTTTPTVTSGSGSFTSVGCSLRYTRTGNVASVTAQITVAGLGTAAGAFIVPLPFPCNASVGAVGPMVVNSTGVAGTATITAGAISASLLTYNAATPGASCLFTVTYLT